MRIFLSIILAFLLFLIVASSSRAESVDAKVMANAQTATGTSTSIDTWKYNKLSVEFNISGTASVEIECQLGDNGAWITLSGSCVPATSSKICSITTYPCSNIRTNVTSCTSCTVTTLGQLWR